MDKKISETEIIINDVTYKRVPETRSHSCDDCAFNLPGHFGTESCTICSFLNENKLSCAYYIWAKAKELNEEFRKINDNLIIVNGEKYKRTRDISSLCNNCAFWDDKCKINVQKRANGIFCGGDMWAKCEDNPTITVDPVIDPTIKKALDRMDYLHRRESKKYKLNFD